MKTIKISIAILSLLGSNLIMAQDVTSSDPANDRRDELQIGFKAGANISNVYDKQGQDFTADSKAGFVGGGFLSIPIGTYLGVQPEVLFSQKGFSATGKGDSSQYSFNKTENWLDIPILFQFKPAPDVYLLAGPEYSYLLSNTYTYTNGVTSESTQQQFSNDNIRHNVLGLVLGLDINIGMGVLSGRVGWDLQDNNGDGTSTLPRYRNVWGQVTLGIRI